MKIFHGPVNIAGIAGTLSKAERALGANSLSYCLPSGSAEYYSDRTIKHTGFHHILSVAEFSTFFLREGWQYDIFNFYFGNSLTLNQLWDIPFLRGIGKRIFFYFHGCDIRNSKWVIQNQGISACHEHWPMQCSPFRKKTIEVAKRYAHGVFVSTPDLIEFYPGSIWIPQPIDMVIFNTLRKKLKPSSQFSRTGRITIAHAPSNRQIKGTAYLEKVVMELRQEGYPIDLLLVENMPYQTALELCARADIVVDQLLIGAYGQFSVEMMALGKPVISYIRDKVRKQYPTNMPIISAMPSNIKQVISEIITAPEKWTEFGDQGIEYVAQIHDSHVVARKTLSAYLDP